MTYTCPLCLSPESETIDVLPYSLLRRQYRRSFDIELGNQTFSRLELRECARCNLRFHSPALIGDEAFYEALQKQDSYYLAEKAEYDFASQHISVNDRVLEVGVGIGAFADKINPGAYEGLELSEAAVAMARKRGLNVTSRMIEEHAKDHACSYDVVCSFQVLEHIADTRSFLEASIRCLKPGGKLIQCVPSEDSFMGRQSNNILNMPPHHATRWTDRALKSVAAIFGLEIIAFEHELLSDVHLPGYCITLIENSVNSCLGRAHRSLDSMFVSLIAKAPIRVASMFLERGLRSKQLRPPGHSVTVIYQKPLL